MPVRGSVEKHEMIMVVAFLKRYSMRGACHFDTV